MIITRTLFSSLKRHFSSRFPIIYQRLASKIRSRKQLREEARHWKARIREVTECPDNSKIPREPGAGQVDGKLQRMFNGILVEADGYYGPWMTELLHQNQGSHEPQEELVFQYVLQKLKRGSRMVECGSYWGFYSLWFTKQIQDGRAWLIEPDEQNLNLGKRNFTNNDLSASFHRAFVGQFSTDIPHRQVSIDDFLDRTSIERLEILHADIQGAEVEMLLGAQRSLQSNRIAYIFISTHSEELHEHCIRLLTQFGYQSPISIPPRHSYSFDGLIVSCPNTVPCPELPIPSRKP